jgi:nucleoside-diphosphate-sugar epimerase
MSSDQIIVFGSSGLLGSNLLTELKQGAPNAHIICPDRDDISAVQSATFLKDLSPTEKLSLFYSHGPTDPKIDLAIHRKFHVSLPADWYRYLSTHFQLENFVTFGSVQETQLDLLSHNPYLRSKSEWSDRLENIGPGISHIQLHTVYGSPLRPRSFIGQMANALLEGSEFRMSDGNQSREYQNAKDVAEVVSNFSAQKHGSENTERYVVSHGNLISLREIAIGVFTHFGALDRLRVGALTTATGDLVPPAIAKGIRILEIPIRPVVQEIIQLFIQAGIPG